MVINMKNLDWEALRKQKLTLLNVIDTVSGTTEEDLTGIVHLIDHIQDEAAKQVGEETVFGKDIEEK